MKKTSSSQETKRSTENITRIVETNVAPSNKYKSTQSLHELGLDNYPNPDMPESSRLSRKEEKQSLQNLNNRLAGEFKRKNILSYDFWLKLLEVKIQLSKLFKSGCISRKFVANYFNKNDYSRII